jgi:hypothetical protein
MKRQQNSPKIPPGLSDTRGSARLTKNGVFSSTQQQGDILLVWRFDRLGRSMPQLVTLYRYLAMPA